MSVQNIATQNGISDREHFGVGKVEAVFYNSGKTPAIEVSIRCCAIDALAWDDPIPDYDTITETRKKMFADFKLRIKQRDAELAKRGIFAPPLPKEAQESIDRMNRMQENGPVNTRVGIGGIIAPNVPRSYVVYPIGTTWLITVPGRFGSKTEPGVIYMLGKITYRDVFPGTREHTTKFCLMRDSGNEFHFCPDGNWMD